MDDPLHGPHQCHSLGGAWLSAGLAAIGVPTVLLESHCSSPVTHLLVPAGAIVLVLLRHTGLRITPRTLLTAMGTVPSAGRGRSTPQQPPLEKAGPNTVRANGGCSSERRHLPLRRGAGGEGGAGVGPAVPRRRPPVPVGSAARGRRDPKNQAAAHTQRTVFIGVLVVGEQLY